MRVDELSFPHPAALYRGDGSDSVAVIHRHAPVGSGRGWARIDESAAGLDPGYLYIEYHSGDAIVYAVGGDASDDPPQEAYRDPRLTPRGEYFEMADAEGARRAAAALSQKTRREHDALRAGTFVVTGRTEDGDWSVTVGPATSGGTRLVLRNGAEALRLMTTAAPRADLERARAATVEIEATEAVDRAWYDWRFGRAHRTLRLTLGPHGGEV